MRNKTKEEDVMHQSWYSKLYEPVLD